MVIQQLPRRRQTNPAGEFIESLALSRQSLASGVVCARACFTTKTALLCRAGGSVQTVAKIRDSRSLTESLEDLQRLHLVPGLITPTRPGDRCNTAKAPDLTVISSTTVAEVGFCSVQTVYAAYSAA